jgi:uncharacterized protein (DUF2147 family)
MNFLLLAALTSISLLANVEPGISSPIGSWLTKDGWTIRISPCGRNLCGVIAQTSPQHDPDTNRPWADKYNVNPTKRDRRVIGIQTLISMKPNGPEKWSGQLYNVDDGKTYAGNLIELNPSTVRVEGCVFGICGGEELTRLK